MKDLGIFKAAIVLLAVFAAGCGMPGGTPSAGPVSSATRQEAAPFAAPNANKGLAGTYTGTIQWSVGSVTYSGPLQTILRVRAKNILGPFNFTVNGQSKGYRLYGRIKTSTSEKAVIAFLIYNTEGGYVTGNGTIANGTFVGNARSAATGTGPSISTSFSVTQSQ